MPHEKFYQYEKWEIEEYRRKLAREQQKTSSSNDLLDYQDSQFDSKFMFNDEELLRQQRKKQKEDQERSQLQSIRDRMTQDKSLQEDMKRQGQLQLELQQAFKRGDSATVKRLERLLAPDDPSKAIVVKHPWA